MSSRRAAEQVQQTLHSMLPRYTAADLPPQLLDLARALLRQSQSRLQALKPEEEPARCCAVCEIACRRLQTALDLPKIEARPPCAPRAYKKMYQLLDKVLEGAGTVETPRKEAASTGKGAAPATPTPGSRKKRKVDESFGAAAASPKPSSKRRATLPSVIEHRQSPSREQSPDPLVDESSLDEDQGGHERAPPVRIAGAGSLMENRFDWLSGDRRAAYERWRKRVLARVDVLNRRALASAT